MRNRLRSGSGWAILPALVALLTCGGIGRALAEENSKAELTPSFWQKDPTADFEDEGRMHCAPTAAADGLIYLAKTGGLKDLTFGAGHDEQIQLIQELAEAFGTDPSIGGTNPDKILTGLQSWLETRGYECDRLELMSWRGVSAANRELKTGTKPDLEWMQRAVERADTVVLLNFGWYYPAGEGDSYERKGGHWVVAVGADTETKLRVHNPLLAPEEQAEQTAVQLTQIEEDLTVTGGPEDGDMAGYYEGDGAGLPHGQMVRAILDAVIVFSLKQ